MQFDDDFNVNPIEILASDFTQNQIDEIRSKESSSTKEKTSSQYSDLESNENLAYHVKNQI